MAVCEMITGWGWITLGTQRKGMDIAILGLPSDQLASKNIDIFANGSDSMRGPL